MSNKRRKQLKKFIFPFVIGATLFVMGCNEENNDLSKGTDQTDALSIIKTYDTELGKLETYYINEEIDESHEENDIELMVTSVEYGKLLLNDDYRDTYEKLEDEGNYNTYIKVGVEIAAENEAYEQDEITFYIYQAELDVQGKKVQADSTFSDKVNISNGKVEMDKGYLYFIIDATMPITSLKLNVPAPFKDGLSISDNYEYKIEL